MKKYKLFFIIYTSFLSICILSLIILAILGSKSRIGYLGDFKFDGSHIIRTLELNGLTHIKENYIIDGKLDEESIKNCFLSILLFVKNNNLFVIGSLTGKIIVLVLSSYLN